MFAYPAIWAVLGCRHVGLGLSHGRICGTVALFLKARMWSLSRGDFLQGLFAMGPQVDSICERCWRGGCRRTLGNPFPLMIDPRYGAILGMFQEQVGLMSALLDSTLKDKGPMLQS